MTALTAFKKLSKKVAKVRVWQKFKPWLQLFLPVFMFGLAFVFADFMKTQQGVIRNADSVTPHDLLVPIFQVFITSVIVVLIFRRIFHGDFRKALLACLIMTSFCVEYQTRFDALLQVAGALVPVYLGNKWPYSLMLLILMVYISGIISNYLVRSLDKWRNVGKQTTTVLVVAVVYLFAVNAVPAMFYLYSTKAQIDYRPAALAEEVPKGAIESEKPDIYYIVLDRYTNNDVLKSTLGFDNSRFLNGLRQDGYYVNDNAYATYPYTPMSLASTLSATFLDDMEERFGKDKFQTQSSLYNLTQYSAVAKELQKIGYEYDVVGSWYGATNKAPIANNFFDNYSKLKVLGVQKYLSEFDTFRFTKGPYVEFFRAGLKLPGMKSPLATYISEDLVAQTQSQLKTLNNLATSEKQGGRFVFAHILVPHDPYFFNADGSIGGFDNGDNNNGKLVTKKYTDQIEYINSEMNKLLTSIKDKSKGKALVVLQADEGYYPRIFLDKVFDLGQIGYEISTDNMNDWSDVNIRAKLGVLAAYHLPGTTEAELAKGADSANIFRLILNHYFKYKLEYLPKCHFGFEAGRVKALSYTDLTPRLPVPPAAACKSVHD